MYRHMASRSVCDLYVVVDVVGMKRCYCRFTTTLGSTMVSLLRVVIGLLHKFQRSPKKLEKVEI